MRLSTSTVVEQGEASEASGTASNGVPDGEVREEPVVLTGDCEERPWLREGKEEDPPSSRPTVF